MMTPDRVVATTCPYCGVGCQIDLLMRDDIIYRVNGRFDNAVNEGQLCVKGRFGCDFIYAPDRLRRPQMRTDRAQPWTDPATYTTWDTALSVVADRLRTTRDRFGPDSIAFLTSAKCTNEENYLMQKLARAVIGTNNVDHCARL
jgi:predicted molibdopterin-dependent oxidoreductase YjgC